MTLVWRLSRGGVLAGGGFLCVAGAVFAWIAVAASRNPADSGESGILLLPFAMPWIALAPDTWLGPGLGLACILANACLLYCIFGGLRFGRGPRDGRGRSGGSTPRA